MEPTARRLFRIALVFLLITSVTGTVLRAYPFFPPPGIDYKHLLHAHSHTGFLGWVFNAFFALALWLWVPAARRGFFLGLFAFLQTATIGMLLSFPFQGYGPVSIAFSSLHLIGSGVFVLALWREPGVDPAARPWLRWGFVFLLLSGLGPLALGPLAALDLREHPAYNLSIYWYLHFQYNGWFVFFPAALAVTRRARQISGWRPHRAALPLLVAGVLLTYAISALWATPPGIVNRLALSGSVLQLAGLCLLLSGCLRSADTPAVAGGITRLFIGLATASLVLKCVAQLAAGIPALEPLANHRFIVIAFLHLVFLGVVLPALLAVAWERNWIADRRLTRASLAVLFSGVLLLLVALAAPVMMPGRIIFHRLSEIFLLAAVLKTLGIAGLLRGTFPIDSSPGLSSCREVAMVTRPP